MVVDVDVDVAGPVKTEEHRENHPVTHPIVRLRWVLARMCRVVPCVINWESNPPWRHHMLMCDRLEHARTSLDV